MVVFYYRPVTAVEFVAITAHFAFDDSVNGLVYAVNCLVQLHCTVMVSHGCLLIMECLAFNVVSFSPLCLQAEKCEKSVFGLVGCDLEGLHQLFPTTAICF
jgi:hypothetical protein